MAEEDSKTNDGNLTGKDLQLLHDQFHVRWGKILRGEESKFTLLEIWTQHRGLIAEMHRRDEAHVAPIDALDRIDGKFLK